MFKMASRVAIMEAVTAVITVATSAAVLLTKTKTRKRAKNPLI